MGADQRVLRAKVVLAESGRLVHGSVSDSTGLQIAQFCTAASASRTLLASQPTSTCATCPKGEMMSWWR
jgi:hypothetical protein